MVQEGRETRVSNFEYKGEWNSVAVLKLMKILIKVKIQLLTQQTKMNIKRYKFNKIKVKNYEK